MATPLAVVGGGGGGAAAAAPGGVGMRMFHGDVFLGEAEVFPMKQGGEGSLPFPSNEIRISHLSPSSERCPPLAILQTVAPFSVRCKLQAKPPPPPSLHRLYLTCFNEYLTCFPACYQVAGKECNSYSHQSGVCCTGPRA